MSLIDLPACRFERNLPKFDREEARRLRLNGMSFGTIAARLGVSDTSISNACKGMPAPVREPKRPNPKGPDKRRKCDWSTAIALNAQGLSRAEIAERVGMSYAGIHRLFDRTGQQVADRRRRQDWAAVVSLAAEGLTQREIGQRLGISQQNVCKILRKSRARPAASPAAASSPVPGGSGTPGT